MHATHTVALIVPARYLPAAHLVHLDVLALGAIVPGAQGICAALPVTAKKPGAVAVHCVLFVRSVAEEYVASLHGSAALAPG